MGDLYDEIAQDAVLVVHDWLHPGPRNGDWVVFFDSSWEFYSGDVAVNVIGDALRRFYESNKPQSSNEIKWNQKKLYAIDNRWTLKTICERLRELLDPAPLELRKQFAWRLPSRKMQKQWLSGER